MYTSILSRSTAIERVWTGDSDVDPDVGHRSDPVLGPDLVFTFFNGSCRVALQGPVTRRTVYPHIAEAQYVGVRFRPGVGTISAETPIAARRDDAVGVERLAGIDLELLCDRLLQSSPLADKGRIVLDKFRASSLSMRPPSPLIQEALAKLRGGTEPVRISHLAADLGVTERSLQRHFRVHLGIGPKHAARLARIERLQTEIGRIGLMSDVSLAALALSAGFFDQAHMTNDVTRVLGVSPGSLVAEHLAHRNSSST